MRPKKLETVIHLDDVVPTRAGGFGTGHLVRKKDHRHVVHSVPRHNSVNI